MAKPAKNVVITNVSIDRDLLARLTAEAEARVLGRNFLINEAIRRFLDSLIPVPDLIQQKEEANEEKRLPHGAGDFYRYLGGHGMQSASDATPSSNPTGDSTGLHGGAGRSESEGSGIHVALPTATGTSEGGLHTGEAGTPA